jgi:hypothetical protein
MSQPGFGALGEDLGATSAQVIVICCVSGRESEQMTWNSSLGLDSRINELVL